MSTEGSDNGYYNAGGGAGGISFADLSPPSKTSGTETSQVSGNGETSMQQKGSDSQSQEKSDVPYESISQAITADTDNYSLTADINTFQPDPSMYPFPDLMLVDELNNPITGGGRAQRDALASSDSSADNSALVRAGDNSRTADLSDETNRETAEALNSVATLCSKDSAIPGQLELALDRLKKLESGSGVVA